MAKIQGGKGKTNNSIIIMRETGKLAMRLRAHTIREQWADRILRIAIHLRTTAKLVQAAKLEVLEGYTGQVIIIINEGEESTLVFSTQTKNRGIAAEQAINNTKEGHPTSCSINTMTRCLVRLAKGSLSR